MSELKSNSNKSRKAAADKKIEPVTKGRVVKKKKNEIQKFADLFFAEDKDSIKSFIFRELFIPECKKIISDIVDALLYGATEKRSRERRPGSRIAYNSIVDDDYRGRRNYAAVRGPGYDYGDIILDSRGDAEMLLTQLDAIIEQYGTASVADLYDLMGTTHSYTDNDYGWSNIATSEAVRLRDGTYTIKLPKAKPLT